MTSYYTPLFREVRRGVMSVWPETKINGVYQGPEIGGIPFERKAEEGEIPFAVVDYGLLPDDAQGASNRSEAGPITIYRVAKRDDDMEALVEELVRLQTWFYEEPLIVGLVPNVPQVSFTMNLPLNQFFLSTQRPFWGGAVIIPMWLVETEEGPF